MQEKILFEKAVEARNKSYSPYSKFAVGAALITDDGRIFTGCNIENAVYGLTVCAERTAIFKAVSEGCRKITSIAVVADTEDVCRPCGSCRQVLVEFNSKMDVLMCNLKGKIEIKKAYQLLPESFDKIVL
jgi:cytidine deaminase